MIASRDLDEVPHDAQRIDTWLHTSVSCSHLSPDSVLPLLLHRTEHILTSKTQEKWKYHWSWQLSRTPPRTLHAIAESSWPDTKSDTDTQSTNLSTWHLIPPCVDQYWNCEWGNGAKGHGAALKQPWRGRVNLYRKKKGGEGCEVTAVREMRCSKGTSHLLVLIINWFEEKNECRYAQYGSPLSCLPWWE